MLPKKLMGLTLQILELFALKLGWYYFEFKVEADDNVMEKISVEKLDPKFQSPSEIAHFDTGTRHTFVKGDSA